MSSDIPQTVSLIFRKPFLFLHTATDPDGGWVHPKELHGLLLGVSRTGLAWDWSGRKELVPAA